MLRASYWQYERYRYKQSYIELLNRRLEQPPVPLQELLSEIRERPEDFVHRRVTVAGEYDFEREIVLRNRRYEEVAGVHVITRLKVAGGDYILVNRGFIPLSKSGREDRKVFRSESHVQFAGLIKETAQKKLFAPSDPPAGPGLPWVDAWLRIDLAAIEKQLPYKILPVSLEIMPEMDLKSVESKMLESRSGRDELFYLPSKESTIQSLSNEPNLDYPIAVFDTVIPPGRHYGYIWEWGIMAVLTMLVGLILQLRPPRRGADFIR